MKKNIIITLILISIFSPLFTYAQDKNIKEINWMTFEEAIEANESEKKFIFIDVFTEWCGWCKKMDNSTFKDSEIVDYMNKHFYAVKLDAEQKEDINYKGNTFKFIDQGRRGYHELAAQLLQGSMSYPSFVILSPEEQINAIIKGYQDAASFKGSLEQGMNQK